MGRRRTYSRKPVEGQGETVATVQKVPSVADGPSSAPPDPFSELGPVLGMVVTMSAAIQMIADGTNDKGVLDRARSWMEELEVIQHSIVTAASAEPGNAKLERLALAVSTATPPEKTVRVIASIASNQLVDALIP